MSRALSTMCLGTLACCSVALAQAPQRPACPAPWVDPARLLIDGDGSEWRGGDDAPVVIERANQLVELGLGSPDALWRGPDDASVQLWIGWNAVDLVLCGVVRDDFAQQDLDRWYQGDGLELFLNTRDTLQTWGTDDWQLMLAPPFGERTWGVYPRPGQMPRPDGGFGGVEVVAQSFVGGYRFEARIPWHNFDGFAPVGGERLGFNLAQCDRDQRGVLESYGTWTGEPNAAQYADRRGTLVLEAPPEHREQTSGITGEAQSVEGRSYLLLALAALYALALWTRRTWRSPRKRRIGVLVAAGVMLAAGVSTLVARLVRQAQAQQRLVQLVDYGREFERLLAGGALGLAKPEELLRSSEALMNARAIPARTPQRLIALAAGAGQLGEPRRTLRRGMEFQPLSADPARSLFGVVLAPGTELSFPLPAATTIDGVALVLRVSDARFPQFARRRVPMLTLQAQRAGQPVGPPRELRDQEDLHFEADLHAERPGMEPAFYLPGGPRGALHGDALLVEFADVLEADELVLKHIGPLESYALGVVALSARAPLADAPLAAGLLTTPAGELTWNAARSDVEVEVTAAGRAPTRVVRDAIVRPLQLGDEPIGSVHLRFARALEPSAWEVVPLYALAALSPFLVALIAEWVATRRRIRRKLAAGFAVTSAVPLLALTMLLESTLTADHRSRELERAAGEMARIEQALAAETRELEREAERLLRIAELKKRVEGGFPETSEELNAWFGESDGATRVFERTTADGRRVRVGSGPLWRSLPRGYAPASGLARPFGQLLVCGVARSAPGADTALALAVLRSPDSLAELARTADASGLRVIGAGRDAVPRPSDLAPSASGEVRRGIFGADGQELIGVLAFTPRQRDVPVLGNYTLNELLLAAGITVLFTVLLFAGILTGRLVRPIEKLDRALRTGRAGEVEPDVADEIGHLTAAIRAFSGQVAERVDELQRLHLAQSELSRRLDPDEARAAVLSYFARHAAALSVWIVWRGDAGEEPRLYGVDGRQMLLPDSAHVLQAALVAGDVLTIVDRGEEAALDPFERVLLGPARQLLALPLVAAGETRGAVVLGFADAAARPDLDFLQAAASQSAIVLENARLYRQAVSDAVTGFLSDPGFRQRLAEEIQRAEARPGAGVLLVQLRLTGLPRDDQSAGERMREAARRLRIAVRGLAVFGRAGAGDLRVAIPWTDARPDAEAFTRSLSDRIATGPWPDGEAVTGLIAAHAVWPDDGPSARFVMAVLEERASHHQSGVPTRQLVQLANHVPVDFVAASPIMVQLLETVQRIAEQDITVLIGGETGVGKDRLAELVHGWSRRRSGPLVHIHCPSLSVNLIEDELFGHAKGAFTGALSRRVGPFEYAAGGTVVLDEVAGLPPAGQVALLRLLETREVVPLGSDRPIAIDVRVIATTSKDLAAEVGRGAFRSDLYFRLNVAQVTVPPLRVRRQAIPALVAAFVRRFNATADRPITAVHPQVMDALFEHEWPGNLRELENALAKACVLASGGELDTEHFDLRRSLRPELDALVAARAASVVLADRQERLLESLEPGQRVSSAEYAAREGVSDRTALRDLRALVELGYLEREGARRGTRFRRTARPLPARTEQ